MNNISIYPVLRKDREDRQGKCPVMLRVVINRKKTESSTGFRIPLNAWDEVAGEVTKLVSNYKLINSSIRKMILETERSLLEHQLTGGTVTKATAKKVLNADDHSDIFTFGDKWIERQKKNQVGSPGTLRHYQCDLDKLKEFHPGSLAFADMTPVLLENFEGWMRREKKNSVNTIWKALKNIRKICNAAKSEGVTKFYPFENYSLKYEQPLPKFKTQEDLEKIWKFAEDPTKQDSLRLVGWYYLLGAHSGLRYSDCARLHSGDIIQGSRLVLCTHKNGEIVSIKIHGNLKKIIKEIGGRKIPSNQKVNDYLKVMAKILKIHRADEISFHTARHTFATQLAEKGVGKEIVQKLLGHRDIKTTDIYYSLTSRILDEAVKTLEQ